MDEFKPGDVVKVSEICGHGVPLPAVGVVKIKTNSDPDWYTVHIKWVEHINESCPACHTVMHRKEDRERECSVRKECMQPA